MSVRIDFEGVCTNIVLATQSLLPPHAMDIKTH